MASTPRRPGPRDRQCLHSRRTLPGSGQPLPHARLRQFRRAGEDKAGQDRTRTAYDKPMQRDTRATQGARHAYSCVPELSLQMVGSPPATIGRRR